MSDKKWQADVKGRWVTMICACGKRCAPTGPFASERAAQEFAEREIRVLNKTNYRSPGHKHCFD